MTIQQSTGNTYRTTNPIESAFATIRNRIRQTKGCGCEEAVETAKRLRTDQQSGERSLYFNRLVIIRDHVLRTINVDH